MLQVMFYKTVYNQIEYLNLTQTLVMTCVTESQKAGILGILDTEEHFSK